VLPPVTPIGIRTNKITRWVKGSRKILTPCEKLLNKKSNDSYAGAGQQKENELLWDSQRKKGNFPKKK